jgi:hypothetical protein
MTTRGRRSRRRLRHGRAPLSALAAATFLLLAGGSALLAAAASSGPAGADTGNSGSGASALGGFTITSLAEAVTAQYEQPNFPLPATPSLEFDEGYASTSDNSGPTGTATASSLYPGQVVANAGPELSLLVPGVPLPPAPVWPAQAASEYPQTPNTANTDEAGVNMDTQSTANGNTASATLGDDAPTGGSSGSTPTAPSGSGNPLASTSSLVGVGTMSATSSSSAPSTTATADATATDSGVSLLGGFVTIGAVTSTATASSDGTTGKLTGSTQIENMAIAGVPVTVNANGIQADGNAAPLSLPISTINTLLGELGISMSVNNATDTDNGPSASRSLQGLTFTIDLKTLDSAANQFASLFPSSFTSQLPVALPDDQQLTLELAALQVSSTASPPFTADTGNTGSGSSAGATDSSSSSGGSSPSFTGNTGTAATAGSFTGDSGSGSSFEPTGSSSSSPSGTSGAGPSVQSALPTSAITPAFKGIGAALVLLGILAAAALALAYRRVDDAARVLGSSSCADGDPLLERFAANPDELSDFGGPPS